MIHLALEREGVELILGYPGGAYRPIQQAPPATKLTYLVTKADDIPRIVAEAFHIATTGRPGQVLIDVCKDAQQAEGEWEYTSCSALPGYRPAFEPDAESAKKAIELLAQAKRPVILAGHGVILSHAEEELLEVAERSGTPVGTTLLGVGAFPTRHPLALHMTGFLGTGWNIKAVQK